MPLPRTLDRLRARLLGSGKVVAERICGGVLLRQLPHGLDAAYDIGRWVPEVRTIVDVGANVGQSTLAFAETWPGARIYSVEPFTEAFTRLQRNVAGRSRIACLQCALGAAPGTARVRLRKGLVTNSLAHAVDASDGAEDVAGTEIVQIRTLEEVCATKGIARIDLLKIDTEGYDLEVLEGARALLEAERISFVQVEAGMTAYNTKHVPLPDAQAWLSRFGYVMFGVYEQTPEWSGEPRLRFSNVVFVSSREMSRRPRPGRDPGVFERRRAAMLASSRADRTRRSAG